MGSNVPTYSRLSIYLIISRLDSDIQATVVNLLLEDEKELMTRKPELLLQQIEDRLRNVDPEEH